MKTKLTQYLLATLLGVAFTTTLHAQLVADGNNVLVNTATNLPGDLIVGTNGGNTRLRILAPGAVTNAAGRIGLNVDSTNNLVLVRDLGAVWNNTGSLYVGDQGAGNLLFVTNGGNVFLTGIRIGNASSAVGNQAAVAGTNSLLSSSGAVHVGYDAPSNSLMIANAASVANNNGYIGNNSASASNNTVTVTDPGSVWNNSSSLYIGNNSGGNRLVVSNGAVVADVAAILGNYPFTADKNTVLVTDPGSLWTNSNSLLVGNSGSGNQLIASNGAVVASLTANMGGGSSSKNNKALITGSDSLWTIKFDLLVGAYGNGNQLVVSNGAVVANASGYLSYLPGSSNNTAVVTGADSLWTNRADLYVGSSGSGNQLLLQDSGNASTSGSAYIGFDGGISNNLIHVDGGVLTVATNLDVRRGTLQLDSGTVNTATLLATNATEDGGGFILFNGGTLSASSGTVDNGAALVVGDGSTAATYQLSGNGLHTFNNGLTIRKFAELTGNGTVVGPLTVQSGGTVFPGTSVGTLVLSNSPTFQGNLFMEISKSGGALTNDQIQVVGPLTYGGLLQISKLGADSLSLSNRFQLFSASNYSGAFTDILNLPGLSANLKWSNQLLVDGSLVVVPYTPPKFENVMQYGTNLVFSISGGSPGIDRALLTSPNVTLPLSNWQNIGSIHFDWLGNATVTNVINFAVPVRFFAVGPQES